jgi:hypothetical protein
LAVRRNTIGSDLIVRLKDIVSGSTARPTIIEFDSIAKLDIIRCGITIIFKNIELLDC